MVFLRSSVIGLSYDVIGKVGNEHPGNITHSFLTENWNLSFHMVFFSFLNSKVEGAFCLIRPKIE